jgi:hypothetical protein
MIDQFTGDYAFLSNFHPSVIVYKGITYATLEHAYQATKAENERDRILIQQLDTPGKAKRMGRKIKMRNDWESIKESIMNVLLAHKFYPGTDLANKLLATGEEELIEGNDWGDKIWGAVKEDGKWVGRNLLGKYLMDTRKSLVEFLDQQGK